MKKNILAWDSATPSCSIALVRTDGFETEPLAVFQEEGLTHSRVLAPKVAELLGRAGLRPADLDLLAVGEGPGGFTGLRTGLALAKGLSMGAKLPLYGFSTLEILAAQILFGDGAVDGVLAAPVVDARHQEFFVGLYAASPGGGPLSFQCVWAPRAVQPHMLAELLAEAAPGRRIRLAGPAMSMLLAQTAPSEALSLDDDDLAPDAVILARLAALRAAKGAPDPVLPQYIRQPDIFCRRVGDAKTV